MKKLSSKIKYTKTTEEAFVGKNNCQEIDGMGLFLRLKEVTQLTDGIVLTPKEFKNLPNDFMNKLSKL